MDDPQVGTPSSGLDHSNPSTWPANPSSARTRLRGRWKGGPSPTLSGHSRRGSGRAKDQQAVSSSSETPGAQRAPVPPRPRGRPALYGGPACPRADPSLARLARRTRAASRRAERGGAGPRACRTRELVLSGRLEHGPGRNSASRPRRAGRGRGDEQWSRGGAPGRCAAPSRIPGRALGPALLPAVSAFGTCGQCWGAFNW